jgi:integrase/recombinase XerD
VSVSIFDAMSPHMDDFDAWERLVGHSDATRKRRRGTLRRFRRDNPVWPADRKGERRVIERWLGKFDDAQTRRSYLGDLRAFFQWALEEDLVAYDPTQGIKAPKIAQRRPTPLSDAQVVACFDACRAHQDYLAVGLGVLAGLRVSEMAHLERRDVDLVSRVLMVRQGKGGKDRAIPVADGLADIMLSYGYTLDSNVGDVVSLRIKGVFKRAGVTGHRPHDLRATFATKLIREGVDLVTVQTYLGHASVATTQRYVLPNDAGVELVNRLSFAA